MGGGSSRSYDYSSSATKKSSNYYAKKDNREYKKPEHGLLPPVGKEIISENEHCLVFLLDVTGSMSKWPRLILDKMPTLYVEANNAVQGITPEYAEKNKYQLHDALDISIIAIGDSRTGDNYPLQVTDFVKGEELEKTIQSVYPEGGGGGNGKESYDLAIYYVLNHCKSKDKNPVCIIAEDEGYYDNARVSEIKKYVGDEIKENINTKRMLKKLSKKYETYVLRKNYGSSAEEIIKKQWMAGVGEDKVIMMSDPKRLVDAAIVAASHAKRNIEVGLDWIRRRQTESQIAEVEEYFSKLMTKKEKKNKKLDDVLNELHPWRK